ncbi:MmyB family transcriptional regulator [Streptomyces luteocolor]|uniref:MmyB family transcriptional regulator n=1 Tax=Streptomyces luteocolor TaxID=285500 RepID=UPI0013019B9F|nr:helix-turn-helix domain-containing protein [Streptomyces luteocolor]
MASERSRTQEVKKHLRDLLRECRARVDAKATVPHGRDRRRPGISQENTAALLGCSTRWYATLESGRMENPTREFLDSVAFVLRMTDQERQALFLYASGRLPPALEEPPSLSPHPDWDSFVQQQVQPACIYTRSWDLVVANTQYLDLLYGDVQGGVAGLADRNILRFVLLDPTNRCGALADWQDSWALPMLSELRAALAATPDDRELTALLRSVLVDPVVRTLWDRSSIPLRIHPDGVTQAVRHPQRGHVEFTVLAANPMQARDLRFVTLMMVDAGPVRRAPGTRAVSQQPVAATRHRQSGPCADAESRSVRPW